MTILGHVQRGGTPTAFDRVLATRFGVEADRRASTRGETRADGRAARHRHRDASRSPRRCAEPKLLDPALFATAEVFFG